MLATIVAVALGIVLAVILLANLDRVLVGIGVGLAVVLGLVALAVAWGVGSYVVRNTTRESALLFAVFGGGAVISLLAGFAVESAILKRVSPDAPPRWWLPTPEEVEERKLARQWYTTGLGLAVAYFTFLALLAVGIAVGEALS